MHACPSQPQLTYQYMPCCRITLIAFKADGKDCPQCGYHTQDGEHLTFHCPAHNTARNNLIGARQGHHLGSTRRLGMLESSPDSGRRAMYLQLGPNGHVMSI